MRLLEEHYRAEAPFLEAFARHEPGLAAKMGAQHDEVLEIAARLGEALAEGHAGTAGLLRRRFVALAQHNLIEEERDVFPVAARCFDF